MNDDFKFDIAIRTWVLGAVLGYLTHQLGWYETTDQAAMAVGGLAAAVYDYLAFQVKRWWSERNDNRNP